MLSNVELILVNFVNINPSYAYEIEMLIERRNLRQWIKIGGTTVYQVLDRLCKKGYLEFKKEKVGNMPERKRYYITDDGKEELYKTAKDLIRKNENYYFDLNIGLACRKSFDKLEFKNLIRERLENLTVFLETFNDNYETIKSLYPEKKFLIKEYLKKHYELELEFLNQLLDDK